MDAMASKMAAGLYALRGIEMAYERTGHVTGGGGNCVKSGERRFALDTRL